MFRLTLAALLAATPFAAVSAQTVTPSTYVMKAGASDLYEKQSSKLVMQSTNPKVREFATMMVADHTKSTADVKAAAMQERVRVAPPKLDAMQMRDVSALRRVKGDARDALYIEQQKAAHQQALALHQGYAADGTSEPLKMAAGTIAPVVQHHIDMLNAM